ncbi:spore gernimation protein [Filobacillus milosensis]|uniref:Spore gernimation protein n=1 Tax=Filobacillus milosensis TaxID=94137 RepID=A0A4Y8INN9_9BACI|nr:endospore germination permease [Filobacillus milosensis]TFB22157.1 spore gernimation protein [Filobacillus milosensis]
MIKEEKINSRQFTLLVIMFTVGSSIIIIPSALVNESRQDGWISAILAMIIGLLLVWVYTTIGKRYSGKSLPLIIEQVMGKKLGKLIILLYFFFSFTLAALVLRNFGDFLNTKIMVETPLEAIHIMFLIPIVYAVKLGIETYSRVAEITFPFILLLLFLLMVLSVPQIELTNIQPIFGEGIKTITGGSLAMIGVPIFELFILTTFFSTVNEPKNIKRSFFIGILIGCSILILITLFTILILGVHLTGLKMFPTYVLAKKISIADFLQRVEIIVAAVWGITLFFKLVLCFHASLIMFAKGFSIKNYRILVIPMSIILFIYSLIAYPNSAYFIEFATKTWLSFGMTFGLVIPLIILIISFIKKPSKTN